MNRNSRRDFLADVGRGMLIASLGPALATDLGLASAAEADKGGEALTFGAMEPLVAQMQQTPADKLLPLLVKKLNTGTDLRTLVAAGALANARTFGGEDYDGYHCFMALAPAYHMAKEMPESQQALPVLKVLYRNTNRMQTPGCKDREVLHPIAPSPLPKDRPAGEALQEATRSGDMQTAEGRFATLTQQSLDDAYNDLLLSVQDEVDVHRVVLAWRAWALLDLTGKERAHTLLRQSVRYCVGTARYQKEHGQNPCPVRTLLPKLLDQHHLLGRPAGTRQAEDAWVERLSRTIYGDGRERAAEAVAAALAEGMSPEAIGEAMALAANQLLLRDPGRKRAEPGKPIGSVHGASVGVHASDAANAWRNIARVSSPRNVFASLIVGAYHTAGQQTGQLQQPYAWAEHLEKVKATDPAELLKQAEAAVRAQDQASASALVQRYGELGHLARPVFDLLLRYAVSEDGALHAEKYYRTVSEEFVATRPAYRWRQLVALARVTASEYGRPAPGYADACQLLKV
jgi:hypothetical protein